jgi:hypothetical protein
MRLYSFFISLLVGISACQPGENTSDVTYHADVKPIIDAKCANCHLDGGVAPFSLTTFDEVHQTRELIARSVDMGTMPPWPPNNDCNDYHYDRSLLPDEKEQLLSWANGAALEGEPPSDYTAPPPPESLETDVVLTLDEPYAPQTKPDDYRCHVLEWPNEETTYITGYEVHPDQAQLVHHVIAFGVPAAQADDFRGFDAAEEGPGYTCFGSPFPAGNGSDISGFTRTRWLASWAPGGIGTEFPAGTGIKMEPGSLVVIQVHYNTTTAEPVIDDSSMSFQTTDEVDRPALIMPYTNPLWVMGAQPMTIPAGEASVTHSTSFDIISADVFSNFGSDMDSSRGIEIHNVGLHMHELGHEAALSIQRADGTDECLLNIPDWDFGWQGAYFLKEPTVMYAGDRLNLQCEWDNSAENQPIIDGEKQAPKDVEWGEGTGDEMCLGIIYLTEPEM